MRNKVITIILSLLLVVSIGINIWQYSKNNFLNVSVSNFQDDIIDLNSDISEKDTEIANLSSTIDELKASLDTATNDIANKDKELEELKAEKKEEIQTPTNTNETDNDVTAEIAADLGLKTTIVDGEICIDLGGDDDDVYVPPTGGDTTPSGPVTIVNPDGTTQTSKTGDGNDDQGPEFGSNHNAPKGHHIQ